MLLIKCSGWTDDVDRTKKLSYALDHPLPPVEIGQEEAPCQEVVIEDPVNVNDYIIPIRHTEYEPELTVGLENCVVAGKYFDGGTDLGYNRMNFPLGECRHLSDLTWFAYVAGSFETL